jgi:hypothetical protein
MIRVAMNKKRDPEFTKLLGNHLLNAKAFMDWGIDRGLTTPEDLRLSITKRRELASEMVSGGMSRRQAAKALGVNHKTIQRDLAQSAPESGAKCAAAKPAMTRTAHEDIAKFAFDQPAADVPVGDPIRHGDFRDLSAELKSNSVDLVFTDPPYDDESLPLYGDMGEVAARVLKPGGSLVTYCGHMQFPDAALALKKHLRFWQPGQPRGCDGGDGDVQR